MPGKKPTSIADLEARLSCARQRERAARARAAQLRRAMTRTNRRLQTQRRCAIGGAAFAMAARGTPADIALVGMLRTYLEENPPHGSNAAALRGTAFDPDRRWPPAEPA